MESGKIIIEPSPRGFFQSRIKKGIKNLKVSASEETTAYLVNLLSGYTHSCNLEAVSSEGRIGRKPLAMIYADAIAADSFTERNSILRRLGDFSLFIAGVFPDSLKHKAVDVDYYVGMGANAYSYLSQTGKIQSNWGNLQRIFAELSAHFITYVDVLGEAMSCSESRSSDDLLRDYELWLTTGSERSRQKLLSAGIVPAFAPALRPPQV